MKKTALVGAIAVACSLAATTAHADFPNVVIDSEIVLNYNQEIDLTEAVNVPQFIFTDESASISINQFNHDSPVTALGEVINNQPTGVGDEVISDIHLDVTAIGNNASINIDQDYTVIGNVQGNQNGGATAVGRIDNNRIDLGEITNEDGDIVQGVVELNVTAVGNNLTIAAVEGCDDECGATVEGTTIGSIQFNYDSPVSAMGSISDNGFGVDPANPNPPAVVPPTPRPDPKLKVSAIGNNLTAPLGSVGSMTQINRNSPISAIGLVSNNLGSIGPLDVDVTAVGNNISIGSSN